MQFKLHIGGQATSQQIRGKESRSPDDQMQTLANTLKKETEDRKKENYTVLSPPFSENLEVPTEPYGDLKDLPSRAWNYGKEKDIISYKG